MYPNSEWPCAHHWGSRSRNQRSSQLIWTLAKEKTVLHLQRHMIPPHQGYLLLVVLETENVYHLPQSASAIDVKFRHRHGVIKQNRHTKDEHAQGTEFNINAVLVSRFHGC
jgi:hypothetical protein